MIVAELRCDVSLRWWLKPVLFLAPIVGRFIVLDPDKIAERIVRRGVSLRVYLATSDGKGVAL